MYSCLPMLFLCNSILLKHVLISTTQVYRLNTISFTLNNPACAAPLLYFPYQRQAFFAWVETTNTCQENLRKALNYTLNHKKHFHNFLLDGRIPLSNNLSEIAVKPVVSTTYDICVHFIDSVVEDSVQVLNAGLPDKLPEKSKKKLDNVSDMKKVSSH